MRVLLKEDHAWPLISAHAWVHVGSVDEVSEKAGIAHVLEHMLFKDTQRYSAEDISRWVEAYGGSMNAETSKEYTHYYIDVPSAGSEKAIRLLGQLMAHASFDPREWNREKPVILEELKRRNDDPEAMLWDLLNDALFQEDHLRRPVIGSVETVSGITRQDLVDFYRQFYRTERTWVVVAGDFKTRTMLEWIKRAFAGMPEHYGPARPPNTSAGYSPQHRTLKRPVHQVYMAMAFPTPPATDPDHEALDLLAAILGEGRASRLVHTLREERKLVWSISAVNYGHEGPGLFSVFAECSRARRHQLKPAIERMLSQIRNKPPTARELERAKNMIHLAWVQSFETYHQQASTLGLYALDDQLSRLDAYLPRILNTPPSTLRAVVDRFIERLPLSSAVIEA